MVSLPAARALLHPSLPLVACKTRRDASNTVVQGALLSASRRRTSSSRRHVVLVHAGHPSRCKRAQDKSVHTRPNRMAVMEKLASEP